ncbi:hypothetical protein ACHAXA_006677 [Cyclostephanos tholiformis]|uniref:MIR domain-containing protein n=1 Tax=Cyclostephanos tholiformis TaxID=382380 RepID=A0ABD3R3B3_9STRA
MIKTAPILRLRWVPPSRRTTTKFVTCGSAIKLAHVESGRKFFLISEAAQIQSGSGQQLVTASEDNRSINGLWQVREGHNAEGGTCVTGKPIRCGSIVRLTHLETSVNLHTHSIRSPLSNQHEVSGFGMNGEGDSGDDWKVVCDGATRNRSVYWVARRSSLGAWPRTDGSARRPRSNSRSRTAVGDVRS